MIDLVANAVTAIRSVVTEEINVDGDREIKVEGSGSIEVEVLHGGPWSMARYNTAKNEILRINVHADVSRSPFSEPVKDDADQRAYITWETIDRLMHDQDHQLGWVVSSYRHSGPTLTLIPNGDGAVMLSAEYEVRS